MPNRSRSLGERINGWGATDDEMRRLPGEDDLVDERVGSTLAITIDVGPPPVLALGAPAAPEMPAWGSIFALEPAGVSSTRFLSRTYDYPPPPPLSGRARFNESIVRSLPFDFVHMITARKKMLSLKALAERDTSLA
jgi:hypothetical protein